MNKKLLYIFAVTFISCIIIFGIYSQIAIANTEVFFNDQGITGTDTGLTFNKNSDVLQIGGAIEPDTNNGAKLGSAGQAFSNLFLASNANIDFANGSLIVGHSSNKPGILEINGGVNGGVGPSLDNIGNLGSKETGWGTTFTRKLSTINDIGTALEIQAYNTDVGTATTFFTLTAGDNPTANLSADVTIDGNQIAHSSSSLNFFASGTTSVELASLITNETGTGLLVFGTNPTIDSLVLSGAVTGANSYNGLVITPNTGVITTGTWNGQKIAIGYGGTNGISIPTAGALAYGTGLAYAFTGVGTSGQILQSAGASAPTWSTATFPSTAGPAGNYLRSDGTNFVSTAITQSQSTPVDPGTTTSTTGVMMGLSGSITPIRSGKVLIIVSGDIDNDTAGNGAQVHIRYGTGIAPSNGSTLIGTTAGALQKFVNSSLALLVPGRSQFSTNAIVTDLNVSTAYWVDLELGAIIGGTARVRDVSISAIEL